MKKTGLLVYLWISGISLVYAQTSNEKDNIIIRSKKERYEYVQGDKKHPVQVKCSALFTFQCNQYRATLPFSETYNDMFTMDKVSISTRGVQPHYSSYQQNGIFYSDARICYFNLPFSKKGETAEVRLSQTCLDPRYFTTVFFPESEYVTEKEVEIVVPRWMQVELREMNFTANISKTTAFDAKRNADVYTYRIKDLPAFKREPNAPGPTYIYPHLMVLNKSAAAALGEQQYFRTLDDQYRWYRSLVDEVQVDKDKMKETALDLTRECTSDLDKIKTLYRWVQEHIRYIAFEDGIAGFKPAAPQEVLSKKYGDCKGMAMLTGELLKALGFDARLVWLGTNHIAYDYSTPSLAVDNHMICALFYDGNTYYLDATEEYIGFDEYAYRIQGRQVLIEDGDNYILERVPVRPATQNTEAEKAFFTIAGGSLAGKVEKTYKGEGKEAFLHAVYSIRKDRLLDALTEYVRHGDEQYQVSGLTYSSLDAMSGLVSLEYAVNTKTGIQQYDNEYYVDLDFRKEFMNSRIDTSGRMHDYWFPYKCHIVHEAELAVPEGAKVSHLPQALHIEREGYRFYLSYTQDKGKIIYRKEITLGNPSLTRDRFAEWNRDIGELKKAYLEQASLVWK